MNIYTLVEGEIGAKKVYEHWIPLVNSKLEKVVKVDDLHENSFVVYSAGGYPNYFNAIESAIEDVDSHSGIDRLVVAVDSEDFTYCEKANEMRMFFASYNIRCEVFVIVQHFCFETWALGNKKFGPRHPKDPLLRDFKNYFNVLNCDPELLPSYEAKGFNRAQFAFQYLRKMINDKNPKLTYSKNSPRPLLHPSYFEEVSKRCENYNHIQSFCDFISAYS